MIHQINKIGKMLHFKSIFTLIILFQLVINFKSIAQIDSSKNKSKVIYTLMYNKVPNFFRYPMLGIVNDAQENYNGVQLGLINITKNHFKGMQLGFIDKTVGDVKGIQIGFSNFGNHRLSGVQIGFSNYIKKNAQGLQLGFVNQTVDSLKGTQIGFVNEVSKNTKGIQIAFVNESRFNTQGLQLGFINNTNMKLKGWQVGLLNVADTIQNGVPVGMISIIRKGGYKALEVSTTELSHFNISFKTGILKLYSIVQLSYNHNFKNQLIFGAGLGSSIKIIDNIYFNPEATYHTSFVSTSIQATVLRFNLQYNVNNRIQIAGGISAVQLNQEKNKIDKPWFNIANYKINDRNKLFIGSSISLSYKLK